jgi:hypothetical protein
MALLHALDEIQTQRHILATDHKFISNKVLNAPEDADMSEEYEALTRLAQGINALDKVETALAK